MSNVFLVFKKPAWRPTEFIAAYDDWDDARADLEEDEYIQRVRKK